jgi:alpha-galactosidase
MKHSRYFAAALLAFAAFPAQAATFSSSASAPAVNSTDVANFAAQASTDKWFFQSANEVNPSDAAKGLTFTTGTAPVLFRALTYKIAAGNLKGATAALPTTWTVRLGTLSGNNFTLIASETANQTANTATGAYMTWTFATPVQLAANTTYAVDVGMLSRTAWGTGIPYLSCSANVTTTGVGEFYDSGDLGVAAATVSKTAGKDRVFHVDLQDPVNPVPADGATVPGGNVALSWTNKTPTTGTDVWVDIWFGTNPAALTKIVDAGLNVTTTTVSAPTAATYYWRIDSYLNGVPTGSPSAGTQFRFFVSDTDSDGLPDSYELLHTTPASNTALNPGDDLDSDGLTNLQEFQRGTLPRDSDTDNDTLLDGGEITGVGARPATNPLVADTDGDGLNDGAETNTGTWVSASNTGTGPTDSDSDNDGLGDGAETNTGSYVSATNTGTSPLSANTDGDNAGDWYEVAAAFTSPVSAASQPNIPYPLPDPDASTGVTNKPVKVFILSGQSNMVGFGRVSGSGTGTLNTIVNTEKKFPHLVNGSGAWNSRADVRYRGVISAIGNGDLAQGFGANTDSFGPELGFGHVMGWLHDEPVLIIKTSIGNRSLLWDIAPPDSARFNYGANTYAGYGDSPNSWTIGGSPTPFTWYAGKQYDDFFLHESHMQPGLTWAAGVAYPNGCQLRHNGNIYISTTAHTSAAASEPGVGASWAANWSVYTVTNVVNILDNWATQYPQWAAQGFEIAGFAWWQGYNDMSEPAASRYEARLTSLINHLRAYYSARYPGKIKPNAPFVLGTIAFGGWSLSGAGLTVANAQLAVGNPALHPEFSGNVKTMEARGYYRATGPDTSQGHHYNHNAETYYLLGDALGRGMVEMLTATTPGSFAAWQAATGATGAINADHDGDGVANGIEWFLGGTTGYTELPGVVSAGGDTSITWTKAATFTGTYGTDFVVETSDTLIGAWTPEPLGVNVVIIGNDVTFTFPSPLGAPKFARLRVGGQ